MKRKNRILLSLLAITILLIGFVRFYIKRDTKVIQRTQLSFFSSKLESQKNLILRFFQNSAISIHEKICTDPNFEAIFKEYKLATADTVLLQKRINEYTNQLLAESKNEGITRISFEPGFRSRILKNRSNGEEPGISNNDDISDSIKPFVDYQFCITNDFIGYLYSFDCQKDGQIIGQLNIGFDFNDIKKQLSEVNGEGEIGYIFIAKNNNQEIDQLTNQKFITNRYLPNFWIDPKFGFPEESDSNPIICDQLNTLLQNKISSNTAKNFSIYINTNKNASYLSISELEYKTDNGNVFLVSLNQDQLLTLVKRLNNAVFIINIIIVLLGMIGIAYLIITRLTILKQKTNILKSEENLKAINQSKDKFFSIIAHDLKNPFNGIMGMSGYLYSEFENVDDAEKKEIINDINISSKNAFNLLQNLLEWTRTQSGVIKNIPVVIDPKQIIEFSLETVSTLAKNKEIEIVQTYLTKEKGFADENLISTVIRNLCTNAIKFSPRNSVIEIIVKTFENDLVFCVKDQGIGLMSEEIDQIFRIDVNFHKRGTEKETGSGLGLKLCKEFIEYCKGRIWVVSEVGKGSSFFFTIPLLPAQK